MHMLILALVLVSVLAGLALANGGEDRPREVLGGGSSDAAANGVSLRATLGQPLAAVVSAGAVTLGQGYWHGSWPGGATYRTYLPLAVRNAL